MDSHDSEPSRVKYKLTTGVLPGHAKCMAIYIRMYIAILVQGRDFWWEGRADDDVNFKDRFRSGT